MTTLVRFQGHTGKIIGETVGMWLVEWSGDDHPPTRLIKGIDGVELIQHRSRGRPAKHADQAAKQRAYRENKKGKALRKYTKQKDNRAGKVLEPGERVQIKRSQVNGTITRVDLKEWMLYIQGDDGKRYIDNFFNVKRI